MTGLDHGLNKTRLSSCLANSYTVYGSMALDATSLGVIDIDARQPHHHLFVHMHRKRVGYRTKKVVFGQSKS